MKDIRVVLTITEEGSPELFAALAPVPPRLRAERVRAIATVGIVNMRMGMSPQPQASVAPPPTDAPSPPPSETDPAMDKATKAARGLLRGLE